MRSDIVGELAVGEHHIRIIEVDRASNPLRSIVTKGAVAEDHIRAVGGNRAAILPPSVGDDKILEDGVVVKRD